jgi:hypothetical protein
MDPSELSCKSRACYCKHWLSVDLHLPGQAGPVRPRLGMCQTHVRWNDDAYATYCGASHSLDLMPGCMR